MDILTGLNKQQKEAVTHIEGPCLVLAGAGSGKTKVLTTRIANLIASGIYAYHILAITFTNKAAKEMKERLTNLVGKNDAFVGTFHSFGLRLIKENYAALGLKSNFTILDSDDVTTIIKKIMKEIDVNPKEISPGYVKNRISFIKNEMLSAKEIARLFISPIDKIVVDIYNRYEHTLKNSNVVDFDDLLKLPVELFKNNDDILDKYQEKYQYILVDEYQDTNEVQYQLIHLLSSKYRNIFVVGDSNQCLDGNSLLYTPDGPKKIADINENDLVLTGIGHGKADYQKIEHKFEREYEGKILTIKTKMGKELTLTPNHICFYKLPFEKGYYYIYLMYKNNKGFRIGKTTSIRKINENNLVNGLQQRLNQEHGDKIWILRVCKTQEEASYYETLFASSYGIPQVCFHACGRRILLNQEQIDNIFAKIDTTTRAYMLMNDHNLDFNYPYYKANGKYSAGRLYINLHYLSGRITKTRNYSAQRLAFNTTDDELRVTLQNAGFNVRNGRHNDFRIETERISAQEAEDFVQKLAFFVPKAEINYDIFLDEGLKYEFLNAGALKENMIIPIFNNGKIIEDTIVKIEEKYVKQKVYDLSIPTTRNIIASDICVHNCIYAFRGSNYKNILNFETDYPDALVIPLNQNYRSTTTILNAANSVIKNNKERKDLELFSELGEGVKIKYFRAYDEKHEATLITEEIKKLLQEGASYNDIAILYRTNGQARILEDSMNNNRFPYRVVGSYYFYKRKEIKDLLAYLKLISNHDDEVSLRRVINVPKRGIGEKAMNELTFNAITNGVSLFASLSKPKEIEFKNLILDLTEEAKDLDLTELIDLVLEKSGMKKELETSHALEDEIRLENLMEFRSITESYQNEVGGVNLEDFLDEISIVSDVADHQNDSNVITLMTMHSAKGLEFKYVFLAGMEENIMPHSMSLQEENGLEEERRLCYVAITRAKERLYLSNAQKRMLFGNTNCNPPSRFITEIDPSLIDNVTPEREVKTFVKEEYYDDETKDYRKGDIVMHATFGKGVIIDMDDKFLSVAFHQRYGIKKILKNYKGLKKV